MATSDKLASLVVMLRADNAMLRADLNKSQAQFAAFAQKAEGELTKTSKAAKRTSTSMLQMRRTIDTSLRGIAGSFAARAVVEFSRSIAKASYDVKLLNQRISIFTGNAGGFGMAYEAAQQLGVAVENVAVGMGRIVAVGASMGVTTAEAKRMTVTFQQLALLSGSSIKESQAAFIQFTQALSSNRLSGEELRSVREQAPLVAQAIAKYMGISIGEIKKVAEENKITATVMRNAMAEAAEDAANKFKELPLTLERQQARMENAWKLTLVGLDEILHQSDMWMLFNTGMTKLLESFSSKTVPVKMLPNDLIATEEKSLRDQIAKLEDLFAAIPLPNLLGAVDEDLKPKYLRLAEIIEERQRRIAAAAEDINAARKSALLAQTRDEKALADWHLKQAEARHAAAFLELRYGEQYLKVLGEQNEEAEKLQERLNKIVKIGDYIAIGGRIETGSKTLTASDVGDRVGVMHEFQVGSEWLAEQKKNLSQLEEFGKEAARNMQSAFADFLFDPFSEGLKGMLKGFVDVVRRMVAELFAQQILTSLFSGMAGSSNSIIQGIGSFFGGGKASGGPVSSSKAYIVGERGPELLVGASGRIVPGTDIGGRGGGMVIAPTYNIDARGATQELAKQLPSILAAHARQTVEMARRAINDDVSRGAFGRA